MKRIARFLSLAFVAMLIALPVHATVSSETTRVKYTCDGTTTVYAYPFKIYENDDILAVKALTSTGAETTLVLNTDYTVSGAGGAGGNVTLTAGSVCGSGSSLTILRNIELTQETDYVDGQAFSAESLESAIDKVTLIQQQQEEKIGRAPKLPKTSSITDIALPNPSANNYIGWNAGATNLENKATPVVTTATQYEIDALVSYGGGTAYTQATIEAALTAIGTSNKVTLLLRPGTWVISTDADYSLYTNVTWKVVPGALLQIASGKTLTIGGPFEAGPYQVFSGDGLVTGLKESRPEWFGPTGAEGTALPAAVAASNLIILTDGVTYQPSSNLVIKNKTMRGVYNGGVSYGTIIKPTSAVTIGIELNSGGTIEGFTLDGTNTSGKVGIKVGTDALSNIMIARDILVQNFTGVNASGIYVANAVGTDFYNVRAITNTTNLYMLGGATLPTTTHFYSCSFREATGAGAWIRQGWSTQFYNPLFEANTQSGLLVSPQVEEQVNGLHIYNGWVEGNYPAIPTNFQLDFNGLTGAVQDVTLEGMQYDTTALSARFRGVYYFSYRGGITPNVAGTINIDSGSSGWIENQQYGDSAVFTVNSVNVKFSSPRVVSNMTSVSNSGAGEDTLMEGSIPASSMKGHRSIKITVAGTKAGAAGNKTVKLYFGTVGVTINAAANDTNDWRGEMTVTNTAAAAQRITWVGYNGATITQGYEAGTENTAAEVVVKATGEVAVSGDEITQTMLLVEYLP